MIPILANSASKKKPNGRSQNLKSFAPSHILLYTYTMRADRLISILMLLQTKGQMTAQELADKLEVSPRTIYRDLEALSMSGVPVYAERGPNGGCMLMESY